MSLKEAGLRGSLRNVSVGVSAIPDSEIDHFETGSLSNYTTTRSSLSINSNSPVYEGSQSLKCDDTDISTAFSTSGLNTYPQKGYVFEMWVQVVSGSGDFRHASMTFGQDIDNNYEVWVAPGSNLDNVAIRKGGNSAGYSLLQQSNTFTPSNSTWYKLEVEWHDGSGSQADNTIVLNVEDTGGTVLDSISAQDSDFASSQGFGVRSAQTSDTQAWDRAHITVPVNER